MVTHLDDYENELFEVVDNIQLFLAHRLEANLAKVNSWRTYRSNHRLSCSIHILHILQQTEGEGWSDSGT